MKRLFLTWIVVSSALFSAIARADDCAECDPFGALLLGRSNYGNMPVWPPYVPDIPTPNPTPPSPGYYLEPPDRVRPLPELQPLPNLPLPKPVPECVVNQARTC